MDKIIIKGMSLRNFKGIRELDVEFSESGASVYGRNGSGKTTLFDAFTWVLFGKDSRDREKFALMTLDEDGQEIPRLQHEVTINLLVNGMPIQLTRRKTEKWTKRRGSAMEEKTGTEEERLWNDIPCSVRDWDEKVQSLCSYEVFKYITSPTFFASQKPDTQRNILLSMIDSVSDQEIAEAHNRDDFRMLVEQLSDKTLAEYKREIGAKQKRIKTELEEYPVRIKECNAVIDSYADIDFAGIKEEIAEKRKALTNINATISAALPSVESEKTRISALTEQLNEIVRQKATIEYQTRLKAESDYRKAESEIMLIKSDLETARNRIDSLSATIQAKERNVEQLAARREECIAEYRAIQAESLTLTKDDFVCPTCGQMLEVKDIEAKKAEMVRTFNERKAMKLAANKDKGMQCSLKVIEQEKTDISNLVTRLNEAKSAYNDLKARLGEIKQPAKPSDDDVAAMIAQNTQYQTLCAQEQQLTAQLSAQPKTQAETDIDEINAARELLQSSIEELNQVYGKKEVLDNRKKMIAQYEEEMRTKSNELARLEGIEFTMQEFARARMEAVEQHINLLFSAVKFKLFENQLNGGWRETCEATVNGVPYSSLNNAMRINAGLDIIGAICKHYGVYAPIFVDNAESVNQLMPMDSQVIRLIVTEDKNLVVEDDNNPHN